MRNPQRRRSNRQGFTLMEILLVSAILVIIASMATFGFLSMSRTATSDLARSEVNTIEQACIMFKLRHMRFPNNLTELYDLPSGMNQQKWGGPFLKSNNQGRDPWNSEYQFSKDEANDRVTIISYGPDGVAGGEDDITNN